MVRLLPAALAAAASMILPVAGAQAKAPPDGIQVCGIEGCARIAWADAERLWTTSLMQSATRAPPAAPSPFYVLRWSWPGAGQSTAYWVLGANVIRSNESQSVDWNSVDGESTTVLEKAAAGLRPVPVPAASRVVVGRRVARDPESFLALFGVGVDVKTWAGARSWIRIRVASADESPWTDASTDMRISAAKGFVWRDGAVFKIALQLARRVRRGQSLAPIAHPAARPVDRLSDGASCQPTTPNGSTPPGESVGGHYHGNGSLWVDLYATTIQAAPGTVEADGSIGVKFPWWRGVAGRPEIDGQRLDAPAPSIRASVSTSYGDLGIQPSRVFFPTGGCWAVTGTVGNAALTFVVLLLRK